MKQLCRLLAVAFVAATLVGCDSKPSAPKADPGATPNAGKEGKSGAAPPPPPPPPLPGK